MLRTPRRSMMSFSAIGDIAARCGHLSTRDRVQIADKAKLLARVGYAVGTLQRTYIAFWSMSSPTLAIAEGIRVRFPWNCSSTDLQFRYRWSEMLSCSCILIFHIVSKRSRKSRVTLHGKDTLSLRAALTAQPVIASASRPPTSQLQFSSYV